MLLRMDQNIFLCFIQYAPGFACEMGIRMRVAIIFTCFNRKEASLRCIEQLLLQMEEIGCDYRFYVCDDQSTDGTYEMLVKRLPKHEIFQSEGNYFWSRGMSEAMKRAVKDSYDYYLLVNDDVCFYKDAVRTMFESKEMVEQGAGIVGTTISFKSRQMTYGGRNGLNDEFPIKPSLPLETCVYANFNCVLLDRSCVEQIGCIDGKYQHGYGDYDYSLRMKKQGYHLYVAKDIVGTCEKNSAKGTFHDCSLSRRERFRKLLSPKGVPVYSYFRYHLRNHGLKMIPACLYGYWVYLFRIITKKAV